MEMGKEESNIKSQKNNQQQTCEIMRTLNTE